jgi:hypothetical protein
MLRHTFIARENQKYLRLFPWACNHVGVGISISWFGVVERIGLDRESWAVGGVKGVPVDEAEAPGGTEELRSSSKSIRMGEWEMTAVFHSRFRRFRRCMSDPKAGQLIVV